MEWNNTIVMIASSQKHRRILHALVSGHAYIMQRREAIEILENGFVSIIRTTVFGTPSVSDCEFLEAQEIVNAEKL